jgi:hypothetical protein
MLYLVSGGARKLELRICARGRRLRLVFTDGKYRVSGGALIWSAAFPAARANAEQPHIYRGFRERESHEKCEEKRLARSLHNDRTSARRLEGIWLLHGALYKESDSVSRAKEGKIALFSGARGGSAEGKEWVR